MQILRPPPRPAESASRDAAQCSVLTGPAEDSGAPLVGGPGGQRRIQFVMDSANAIRNRFTVCFFMSLKFIYTVK